MDGPTLMNIWTAEIGTIRLLIFFRKLGILFGKGSRRKYAPDIWQHFTSKLKKNLHCSLWLSREGWKTLIAAHLSYCKGIHWDKAPDLHYKEPKCWMFTVPLWLIRCHHGVELLWVWGIKISLKLSTLQRHPKEEICKADNQVFKKDNNITKISIC